MSEERCMKASPKVLDLFPPESVKKAMQLQHGLKHLANDTVKRPRYTGGRTLILPSTRNCMGLVS